MNYNDIIKAGVAYADRFTDLEVTDNLDLFLRFGEAHLSRKLRVRKASMRAILSINTDSEYYSLPPDFGGFRDVQINTIDLDTGTEKKKPMRLLNPEQFELKAQESNSTSSSSNDFGYYSIEANQIRVTSVGLNDSLEILYYQNIPPLSAAFPNNWVSEDHPDMYLAVLMYEIELFVKNQEIAVGWEARLDKAMDELDIADVEERWSGTPMTTKTDFNTGNRRP